MTWGQPAGVNVEGVSSALRAYGTGAATWDDVLAAMSTAEFAVRPTAQSVDDLAENWDYQVMPQTATDTIQVALFQGHITFDQYKELMDMAQYTGPGEGR